MQSQWQPIETAPKDGTSILIYTTGRHWREGWSDEEFGEGNKNPEVMEASWQPWYSDEMEGWMPANLDEEYGRFYEATHWMPLPEPPKDN